MIPVETRVEGNIAIVILNGIVYKKECNDHKHAMCVIHDLEKQLMSFEGTIDLGLKE